MSSIFSHNFNGKLMILFLLILFITCFIIILFHVYSRWYRIRRQNRHQNRRQFIASTAVDSSSAQGLDLSVMCSIPTFIYKFSAGESPIECAVCLCEFEVNESGRVLPECKHNFHVACIDTWLRSHSDCPICRTRVVVQDPVRSIENPLERIVVVSESEQTVSRLDSNSSSSSSSPVPEVKIKQLN